MPSYTVMCDSVYVRQPLIWDETPDSVACGWTLVRGGRKDQ